MERNVPIGIIREQIRRDTQKFAYGFLFPRLVESGKHEIGDVIITCTFLPFSKCESKYSVDSFLDPGEIIAKKPYTLEEIYDALPEESKKNLYFPFAYGKVARRIIDFSYLEEIMKKNGVGHTPYTEKHLPSYVGRTFQGLTQNVFIDSEQISTLSSNAEEYLAKIKKRAKQLPVVKRALTLRNTNSE